MRATHSGSTNSKRHAKRILAGIAAGLLLSAAAASAHAQKKYGPGVTDAEIKIGQTMAYSGPASAFGLSGKVAANYFRMINARGGINGRKIALLSLDDAYSPPRTVEQTRKLVEEDQVLAIAGTIGTPTNLAIAKYLNGRKVPHLLIASGSPKLNDPKNLPWTTIFYASQYLEGKMYAQYLLKEKPNARIGVLLQNDDLGKGYLAGLKAGLGAHAARMIVKEASYDLSDPTIDSQVLMLKESGADVLFQATTPRFSALAIRRAHEIGWRPTQIVVSVGSAIATALKPAGLEASAGVITAAWLKSPDDATWENDPGIREFMTFMKTWSAEENALDSLAVHGYTWAQMMAEILRRCGDDLTRENLIRQATNVRDFQLPLLAPGAKITITPDDRVGWRQSRLQRFDGTKWVLFGDLLSADSN